MRRHATATVLASLVICNVGAGDQRVPLAFVPADCTNLMEPRSAALRFWVRLRSLPQDTAPPGAVEGLSHVRATELSFGDTRHRLFAGVDGGGHYQIVAPTAEGWTLLDSGKPGAQQFVQWSACVTCKATVGTIQRRLGLRAGGGVPPQWVEVRVGEIAVGQIDLGGKPMGAALLSRTRDLCVADAGDVQLLLDLDRDGVFSNGQFSGTEVYQLGQTYEIQGKTMVFSADLLGRHLLVKSSGGEGTAIGPQRIGLKMPNLQAKRLDGSPWRLSTCQGSPVVLYLFDPGDRRFVARAKRLKESLKQAREVGKDAALKVIGISLANDAGTTRSFVRANELPGEILLAGAGWDSPCVTTLHLRYLGNVYYVDKHGVFWPANLKRSGSQDLLKAFLSPDAPESKTLSSGICARARVGVNVQRLCNGGRFAEAQKVLREFAKKHPTLTEDSMFRWVKQMAETEFDTPRVVGTVE